MFRKTQVSRAVLLALAGAGAVAALPVQAQQVLERVEITGTSLRRIEAETALPVTVIRVEELTKQGINTAEQALSTVAANQSNFGVTQAIGATTGGKAEADIRGLSGPTGVYANKTLVLLNGRRLANHPFDSAAVDLNAIPLAAVDRIEILRDGASAIYGTDAIGGVINFILRRDYQGLTAFAEHLQPQASGGGDTSHGSISGGFGSLTQDRFNIVATLDFRKQRVLEAKDRSFAKTGVLGPSRADLTSGTSGTAFPGDLNGFEPTAPNCNPPRSLPRFSNPDNTGTFQTCRYDFTQDIDIIPENEQVTGLIRGSLALTPQHTASVEYLYANNKATSRVAPAPISHVMPTTSPFYPPGAPIGSIPDLLNPGNENPTTPCLFDNCVPGGVANWRQVPGGKRTSGDDTTNERGMLELQGTVRGWDYRTAVGKARSKSAASVKRGYVNDDLMQQGVWDGVINPFGDQTPAGQAAIDAAQVRADTMIGKADVDFADVRATGDLVALPAGPLSMAVGVEYRREKSSFVATDITAALPSLGIDPDSDTSGSRNVKAVFVEFGVPVVKTLDLTFAARYDDYSDFGNTTNPKVSFRWQPARQFLLRGSYNKGFRAPTLYEIHQPRSLTYTSDNYDDPLLCPDGTPVPGAQGGVVCGQQVLQRQSGPVGIGLPASALQPEKSDTVTLGAVFQPVSAVTVGVDLWRTKIKSQILGLPEQTIFGDPTKYASRFVRCSALSPAERSAVPSNVCSYYPSFDPIAYIDTPNENLGDIKVSGVDLSAAWRIGATAIGNLGLLLDGTYVTKFDYQREKGGEFFNAAGRYADNAPVFRWQQVVTLTWNRGPWGATLSHRFKSGYKDQDEVSNVGSYEVVDASLSFVGVKNLTLTAGIRNLLDRDPPRTAQVSTFQRGYDPRFTDPLGRTFLLQASYKFF